MLIRLLSTYLRRYKRPLAGVVVLQTVQALAALLLPGLNASIIDDGVLAGDNGRVWSLGGWMLVVTAVQATAAIGAVYFGARTALQFGRDVRGDLFHQVTSYSAQEVGRLGAPSLINRITNDVQQVQMFVVMTCNLVVSAPVTCIGGIVLALRDDVGLGWILVVAVPTLAISLGGIIALMIPQFRRMQDQIDRLNQILREQITGVRVVRAFVREDAERRRFQAANDDITATALRAGTFQAFMFPTVFITLNASCAAVVWFGGQRVDVGDLAFGDMVAYLTYIAQILMSVMMATFIAVMAPRAAVCAERITEVLRTPTSVADPSDPVRVEHRGEVRFDDVTFHYPGAEAPVLRNVSLTCRPGTTTAVIGSTGSGKTTLLGLIPRLFDATGGAVRLDGVDVRHLALEDLWAQLGLVPQKPFLFSGTVASNLRFAKADATDEELWDALEVAQAADFVRAMPDGLHGRIAQGGSNVSGGQRQRLAIARAIVRRPKVYLFDDSFSALDLATDARLRAALAPITTDATVLVVAQRVSTIRNADQIVVLEDGAVVGIGTHDDLVATCPTYQEIVDSQATAGQVA